MTYLSRAANAEPFHAICPDPKLASAPSAQPPAVVAPVLELGWLIVAFPGIMSTSDAGQTAAVDGVRRALGPRVRQDALAVANEDPGGFAPNAPAHAGSQASSEALSPWDKRTKSGKAGKTEYSLHSSYSFDKVTHGYPLQRTYGQGNNGFLRSPACL